MIGYYSTTQINNKGDNIVHVWLTEDGKEVEVSEVISTKERLEEHKNIFKDTICRGKVISHIKNKECFNIKLNKCIKFHQCQ